MEGADLVIVATSSPTPVIETAWLEPDVVVTTLGPKQEGRAEFPIELVTEAAFVVTDSPAQLGAYTPPAIAAGVVTPVDLADVTVGAVEAPAVLDLDLDLDLDLQPTRWLQPERSVGGGV